MKLTSFLIDQASSDPIQGVSVVAFTSERQPLAVGTQTGEDGSFYLDNGQITPDTIIEFSHVSYQTRDIAAADLSSPTALTIKQDLLDEVIVKANHVKKKLKTNNTLPFVMASAGVLLIGYSLLYKH